MRPCFRPLALAIACLVSTSALAAVDGFNPNDFKVNQGLGHAALTKAKKSVKVVASLPITYGLAEVLLKGTDVKLERAAPANLPGSRQVSYFTGRGAQTLNTLASDADADHGQHQQIIAVDRQHRTKQHVFQNVHVDLARQNQQQARAQRQRHGEEHADQGVRRQAGAVAQVIEQDAEQQAVAEQCSIRPGIGFT